MTITHARRPRFGSPARVAGLVLLFGMSGHAVLSAPEASAGCTLTPQDEQYINLLARDKMIHGIDYNDCHMVTQGRWFADQVRNSPDPLGTGKSLVKMVADTTPANAEQAEFEVEAAIFVYAPEMIPTIKDQFAQSSP